MTQKWYSNIVLTSEKGSSLYDVTQFWTLLLHPYPKTMVSFMDDPLPLHQLAGVRVWPPGRSRTFECRFLSELKEEETKKIDNFALWSRFHQHFTGDFIIQKCYWKHSGT